MKFFNHRLDTYQATFISYVVGYDLKVWHTPDRQMQQEQTDVKVGIVMQIGPLFDDAISCYTTSYQKIH